jgi:hypothetical protein
MKRTAVDILVDVVIALGLGLGVWLSQRRSRRYVETKASR